MKIPKILYAIILLCALTSCLRKVTVQCKPAYGYLVRFYVPNIGDTIPDTTLSFTPYQKGSNFSIKADSSLFTNIFLKVDHGKAAAIPKYGTDCDKYDWKIVLYPSGRHYLLKNIILYPRSEKQVPQDTQPDCFDDYSYEINDSVYSINHEKDYNAEINVNY